MPGHLHTHVFHRGSVVEICDVRCRACRGGCGGEERSSAHEIVLPRAGVFLKHVAGREVVADSNHVLFFNRHEPYRVSHPADGGDDCTVFAFADDVLSDVLRRFDPAAGERPGPLFRFPHAPNTAAVFLFHQQLRRALRAPGQAGLQADELAIDLLETTVEQAHRIRGQRPAAARDDTRAAHQDAAAAAKTFLAARFREKLSLAQVARAAHCSQYHLARLFRGDTGLSLHEYQDRLRLAAALERLVEDRRADLTALAFDLGYSSHSHFTAAFRRQFRLTPSRFRRTATVARLRETSTKLTA